MVVIAAHIRSYKFFLKIRRNNNFYGTHNLTASFLLWSWKKITANVVIHLSYHSSPWLKWTYCSSCCSNPTVARSLKALCASSVTGDTTSSAVWQKNRHDSFTCSERNTGDNEKYVLKASDPFQVDTALSKLSFIYVSIMANKLHHCVLANH